MLSDLKAGWMRQIIENSSFERSPRPSGCVGHFFDKARNRKVTVELGNVSVFCPFSFRAASSEDEPLNVLSWVDGVALNDELPAHVSVFFDAGCDVSPVFSQ